MMLLVNVIRPQNDHVTRSKSFLLTSVGWVGRKRVMCAWRVCVCNIVKIAACCEHAGGHMQQIATVPDPGVFVV